jgi:hypothetical protein
VWRHRVGVSLIAVRHGSGSGSNSGKWRSELEEIKIKRRN